MIARPYEVATETRTRRFPVLVGLIRGGKTVELLQAVAKKMSVWDVLIGDRQVKISHLFKANVAKFVVRSPRFRPWVERQIYWQERRRLLLIKVEEENQPREVLSDLWQEDTRGK
jgi:hypothetical protein